MTTESLTFTRNANGAFSATFTSQGGSIIQIDRAEPSLISVSCGLPEMDKIPVGRFANGYTASEIFNLDVPSGVEVTIESGTAVTAAKIMYNE